MNCDFIVPSSFIGAGTLFSFAALDGGKYMFKDYSDLEAIQSPSIRLPSCPDKGDTITENARSMLTPCEKNDIICFYGNTFYQIVEPITENLKIQLFHEPPYEGDKTLYQEPQKEVTRKMAPFKDVGVLVVKSEKKVLKGKVSLYHPQCSGVHARIFDGGIVDHSMNGTSLIPKFRVGNTLCIPNVKVQHHALTVTLGS